MAQAGEWTEAQNQRLLSRMTADRGASGEITLKEFSSFFNEQMPQEAAVSDDWLVGWLTGWLVE